MVDMLAHFRPTSLRGPICIQQDFWILRHKSKRQS